MCKSSQKSLELRRQCFSPKVLPYSCKSFTQIYPLWHFATLAGPTIRFFILRPLPDAFSPVNNGLAVASPTGTFKVRCLCIKKMDRNNASLLVNRNFWNWVGVDGLHLFYFSCMKENREENVSKEHGSQKTQQALLTNLKGDKISVDHIKKRRRPESTQDEDQRQRRPTNCWSSISLWYLAAEQNSYWR